MATELLPFSHQPIRKWSAPPLKDGTMGPSNGVLTNSKSLLWRVFLRAVAVTVLLTATTGVVCLLRVGKWLVKEDRLEPTTAIVVLSGNTPARALEAAQLYYDGYAKEIWLTHPGLRVDELKELGIRYPAEDDVNVRVLRRVGVPAKAIRVLDTPIVNTDEELDVISAALQNRGGRQKVIIVTNKTHTRRVRLLWDRYYSSRGGQLIVHAVSDDPFEPERWWQYSASINQVMHEVMGIVNAWSGMPVQAFPLKPSPVVASGQPQAPPEHPAAD